MLPWVQMGQEPLEKGEQETVMSPARKSLEKQMSLAEMKEGDTALICTIIGGRHLKARLDGLGIREGKRIRLISTAPFQGPLLVEDTSTGARVMIGRGMASSIKVGNEASS